MATDRRKFLQLAGLSAVAVTTLGFAKFNEEEERFAGDCATTDDILGPFYRPEAPDRSDLTYASLKGLPLVVEGRIFQSDCTSPLKGAKVEIWQADHKGAYDNNSDKFRGRGLQIADDDGKYSFKTIYPGRYKNGRLYRPSHIHFRVTGAGHKELISQIYFQGDPYIAEDPWAGADKAELRVLPFAKTDDGYQKVVFDVYLAS